jgi:adenylate cyclase
VFSTLDGSKAPGGVIMTWATNRTGGFSNDDLACLQSLQQVFALACKSMILSRISGTIATTYLGQRAGANVLNGSIRRGDGQHMSAVIWYSDLRNSTMFSESLASDSYFSLLNAYFETTAGPLVSHGGEVLDFIGDAVLGIFPFETESDLRDAAARANAALDDSLAAAREVNAERGKNGLEKFRFGVGLNVGDVKFGNIGIPERLSFSVIGQAVNEAARIESLTKLLQQPVLAGRRVAQFDESRWRSVGAHKLEGVLDPVELFAFRMAQAA